ncbi:MAG: protein translocase SEC61 complex subunit gamma [Promethearchaeia archaeon]
MSNRYPKYAKYSKDIKSKKPSLYERLSTFFTNARRILKIANKPTSKEYWTVFKIVAIGMVILGVLSYIIQLIFSVVLPVGK